MTLVKASYLGIERFAGDRNKENWSVSSQQDKAALIRTVYKQVLGNQYVMESERLSQAESLFKYSYLSVREFVRTVAKSGLYRSKFFENCNPYHFIELNHKHLLGRAPQNKAEMLHHFTILQEQGYDAEIDSYLDNAEYQERFGEETVPYVHGWDYSKGHEGRQFSWLMQLARGVGASVKGESAGINFRLGKALHQDRALPVVSPNASGSSYQPTQSAMKVSAGTRGTSFNNGRQVTLTVTSLANNDYSRTADMVMNVPYTRMNETMRMVQRMGGKITGVAVSGGDLDAATASAPPARKKTVSKAAKAPG